MGDLKLYVGTYTQQVSSRIQSTGVGITVLDYDTSTGALSQVQQLPGIENPSYLAVSPDGRVLHAVSETEDGQVMSYEIDYDTGHLSLIGSQSSRGARPCYVAMDSRARAAFVSNYKSGSVAMFPIRADGSLAEATSFVQHNGMGPDTVRQAGPHAHCVVVAPTDDHAFVADLGADAIFGYALDYEHFEMVPHARLNLMPGSGPRHLVFDPQGRLAFVINELDSTLAGLAYDAENGTLKAVASLPTVPDSFGNENLCADIQVHPLGEFVYCSNRGHDSIAMYRVNQETGRLRLLGYRSTEGKGPRNFKISPDGRRLLVANQDSNNIVTLEIDVESGIIGETVSVAVVARPVCMAFSATHASATGATLDQPRSK
ncbi:MAG: lactonase family protein [Actinomycetota bacterium]